MPHGRLDLWRVGRDSQRIDVQLLALFNRRSSVVGNGLEMVRGMVEFGDRFIHRAGVLQAAETLRVPTGIFASARNGLRIAEILILATSGGISSYRRVGDVGLLKHGLLAVIR